jgi:hypothetical protein
MARVSGIGRASGYRIVNDGEASGTRRAWDPYTTLFPDPRWDVSRPSFKNAVKPLVVVAIVPNSTRCVNAPRDRASALAELQGM